MRILLIGPKGSGKSHIAGVLQRRLGVHFFHVEPHWMAYHTQCSAFGRPPVVAEGIARVHPMIAQALRQHAHVCVETTGASDEILSDLLAMGAGTLVLKVRVRAPVDLCLERIKLRDCSQHIPMDDAGIRRVHALSERCAVEPDVFLDGEDLTDDEIVVLVGAQLRGRPHGPAVDME